MVTLGVEALAGAAAMAGGTGDGMDQASTGAAVDGLARVVVDTGEAHAVVE